MKNEQSSEAWNHVRQNLPERWHRVVGAIIALNNSATINEVAEYLGVTPNTVSGRFTELSRENRIVKVVGMNGKPLRRKSAAGVSCQVWRYATPMRVVQTRLDFGPPPPMLDDGPVLW